MTLLVAVKPKRCITAVMMLKVESSVEGQAAL
jgi:hypothetical protein